MTFAIISALILASLNTGIAVFVIRYASVKNPQKFNDYVFGSMTVRYLIMTLILWFSLVNIETYKLTFALTFVSSVFVLTMAEIFLIHFRSKLVCLKNNTSN
jgi:hypothetical protein